MTSAPARRGIRPEPPPFRRVVVDQLESLTPFMTRVSLTGPELVDFPEVQPAASVRLWVPNQGSDQLPELHWDGNRYRLSDGGDPVIRTFTPLNYDPAGSLELEVVIHEEGAITQWLESCESGSPVGVSEPGRGYAIDRDADSYVLLGDESALPAIKQILSRFDSATGVQVAIEVRSEAAAMPMPPHPGLEVSWATREPGSPPGAALLVAMADMSFRSDTKVWAAGEAGAMHGVRSRLSDEIGLDRKAMTVRGYWKHGR